MDMVYLKLDFHLFHTHTNVSGGSLLIYVTYLAQRLSPNGTHVRCTSPSTYCVLSNCMGDTEVCHLIHQ